MRVALVAGDPIRHQDLMAIIRGGGHAVVEHHGEADVVLVEGESVDLHGPPAVTLGGADSGQAGVLPADATAVQIDAALLAAAAGLIVRVPGLSSPSFESLDDGEALEVVRRPQPVDSPSAKFTMMHCPAAAADRCGWS
jgi:hypothetical protein